MNCDKCGNRATALYGIPTGKFRVMSDPLAPKWCYDCYVQDYGTEEELAAWIDEQKDEQKIDLAIARDIDHSRHGI